MQKIEKIHLLTKTTGWYGGHSGYYEQLPVHLADFCQQVTITTPRRSIFTRGVGKAHAWLKSFPQRDQSLTYAEMIFRRQMRKSPETIGHILNFEEHYLIFHPNERILPNIFATIHIPPTIWDPLMEQCLSGLSAAIVLYTGDIPYFEDRVGNGRVKFIPHGVDTEFFRPDVEKLPYKGRRRIVFAGQYLRNTEMLNRVIQKLLKLHPELEFDLLVPKHAVATGGFSKLIESKNVTFHNSISDSALLGLYQKAYLMLLPMNDSGANNSVVEALACGLPIVTTDVGGIRDYGGNSLFPLVANDDDKAMISLIERYLNEPEWRELISHHSRDLAVEQLSWQIVAEKHLQAYNYFAN